MIRPACAVIATSVLLALCWGFSQQSTFKIGDTVQIILGPLKVREAPGLSANNLGLQQEGAVGVVIGGPTESDSIIWYQIDYQNEVDGWSAFGLDNAVYLSRLDTSTTTSTHNSGEADQVSEPVLPQNLEVSPGISEYMGFYKNPLFCEFFTNPWTCDVILRPALKHGSVKSVSIVEKGPRLSQPTVTTLEFSPGGFVTRAAIDSQYNYQGKITYVPVYDADGMLREVKLSHSKDDGLLPASSYTFSYEANQVIADGYKQDKLFSKTKIEMIEKRNYRIQIFFENNAEKPEDISFDANYNNPARKYSGITIPYGPSGLPTSLGGTKSEDSIFCEVSSTDAMGNPKVFVCGPQKRSFDQISIEPERVWTFETTYY